MKKIKFWYGLFMWSWFPFAIIYTTYLYKYSGTHWGWPIFHFVAFVFCWNNWRKW